MSSTEPILRLSEAANSDLAHTSDLVTDSMSSLGVQTEQLGRYLDIVAQTQASANTTADGMLEAYIEAGGMFKSFNTPLEESAALIGVLANRGIKASEAGHSLNSLLINLMGTTSRTSEALQQLGVKAYDDNGNFRGVETTLRDVKEAMSGLTDEQEDMLSANLGGKTQITTLKALLSGLGEEYDTLKQKVTNSDGALNRMATTMQDNLKGQWTVLKSAIEGAQIDLGEKLAPYMKQFVTWFTNKIPEIKEGILSFVDYISNNTDKLLALGKVAVTVTGSIMALSLASKTLGAINGVTGFISSVRAIQTGAEAATSSLSLAGLAAKALPLLFSPIGIAAVAAFAVAGVAIKGYNDLMDESCLKTTEQLSLSERFMNSITGHKIKTEKEMEELGLVYNDFGYGVSDSFKTAAKDASKSLLDIEMNINRMSRNGSLNGDKFDSFKNYINNFVYDGINAIKSKQSQVKEELNKTFGLDGAISENEQNTLDYLEKYYQAGIDKELELRDEIYEIGSKAIADHGAILDSDMAQIKEKLAEIQALKLEYANAENEGERAYASSKFKSAAERVSGIEDASTLLQDRAKEHQDKLDEIQANYDKSIAYTKSLIESATSDEDKQNLQNELDDLQKTRDESLKQAEEDWKSDLETLYEAYPSARGKLNEDTGKAFSVEELNSQDDMSEIQYSHSQLEGITTSGVYTLQNDVTKNLETLYVSVDEATGRIKGILNGTTGEIGAYSDEQKEKLMNLQDEYSKTGSDMQQLVTNQAMLNTSTDEVVNHFGDVVGQLENVQTAEDGTVTGILDLNGTPIQITSNAEGTITSMNEVTKSINAIPKDVTISISTITQSIGEGVASAIEGTGAGSAVSNVLSSAGYASGTDNATAGLHPVAEEGFEIITNPSVRNFRGGEKVLNHDESVEFLKNQGKVKQGTYQVAQPQVQIAGGGNIDMGGININVDGSQNVEAMINQAMLQFGNTLRQAFSNIKK